MPTYKLGKIDRPFGLDVLAKLMERVPLVDRSSYSVEFIQALLAQHYWFPFRRSEIVGDSGHKWRVAKRDATGKIIPGEYLIRHSEPFPGLLWSSIWIIENYLFCYQVARKHGHREAPIARPLSLPYIDLIKAQWERTKPGQRIYPIDEVTMWRIIKRIDPKLYSHAFLFNRITKQAMDPETSIQDIVQETGKDPKTIAWYMARAGRDSRKIGDRLKQEH